MFEFDRTRRPSKQVERLQRYDWFLTVGWREGRYACLDIEPAVLFICTDDVPPQAWAAVPDSTLSAGLSGGAQPDTTAFPGREQVGFTSAESLRSGVDRLVQATPAFDRYRSRPAVSFTTCLAIERLFARPVATLP